MSDSMHVSFIHGSMDFHEAPSMT